jgi:hypothetical protein
MWRLNNPDKVKAQWKRYREKHRDRRRIGQWKSRGIIFHDYDLLHDIYTQTTHCDRCKCCLTMDNGSTQKCLDHDHTITDDINVRNILCKNCNFNVG